MCLLVLFAACSGPPAAPPAVPTPPAVSEAPAPDPASTARALELVIRAEIPAVADGRLDVFLPLPRDAEAQRVGTVRVDAPIPGREGTDGLGNRFWHGQVEGPHAAFTATVTAAVHRDTQEADLAAAPARRLTDEERVLQDAWLRTSDRVPVGRDVDILAPILAELGDDPGSAAARARQIYDWVVDNVEYKKTGTGWGNGDIYWACSERYGNCTDFHTLFLALARTEGVPGRFEMGFPVPRDRAEGEIGGYHCWLQLWLPQVGWFPIDASEAAKHPEQRELLFGTHPADRVLISIGRDLRLGPDHRGPPLNTFVHPYAELDGVPVDGITRTVTYAERP